MHLPAFIFLLLLLGPIASLSAGDWPMWRYDASRGNASPDALPGNLHLQWVRHFPEPVTAWPASQTKLQFDAVLQPVVSGGLMVVGSTVNDSATAYDTTSGERVWQFFTDGPVRFAPVIEGGKVYLCSDDGYLYCLALESGELQWKYNGGPTDRRAIGNGRLVSSWPARGGLVVDDGTVYFTASIWPFMGIFIHAVDADSGKRVWVNSETGSQWMTHPHGAPSFGSIVPQGYLAISGDNLIVPGGRSLPAVLDRQTGQVRHFNFGGKGSGGWDVVAGEKFYSVGNRLFDLKDGKEVGSYGADVMGGGLLIDGEEVLPLAEIHFVEKESKDRRGKVVRKRVLEAPGSWKLDAGDWKVLAMAGGKAFVGSRGKVASFDIQEAQGNKGKPTLEWTASLEGEPAAIVAGDERLFVVTEDARIYCFGEGKVEPKTFNLPATASLTSNGGAATKWADDILGRPGTSSGYAVAWGLGSGDLVEELARRTNLHIIAVDSDSRKVSEFRQKWGAAGLYGSRVVAQFADPLEFHFPPYLANLVFIEEGLGAEPGKTLEAVKNVLRPYGGTAFWPTGEEAWKSSEGKAGDLESEGFESGWKSGMAYLRREGALPGTGDWSHQYADASNSVVSNDTLVKAPLGLLWFGGPPNDKVLPRHGHGPSPQVAGGRLVIEGANMLRCVDVYTGRVLWERDLPGLGKYYDTTAHFAGAGEIGSNYVTMEDAVYVVYGPDILELEPGTGETRRKYQLEPDATNADPFWGFIAVHEDLLVATSSPVKVDMPKGKRKPAKVDHKDMVPVIKPGAEWSYLAGKDPVKGWNMMGFKTDNSWKTGPAGFGYGDGDDETELKGMKGNFLRVYIRHVFSGKDAIDATDLTLAVNYDDAFIAYLNGKEIARGGVRKGFGAKAEGIASHEAGTHEFFKIQDFRSLLLPGQNVLALEGHNSGSNSSDFSLDPYLLAKRPGNTPVVEKKVEPKETKPWETSLTPARYASASRRLAVFERSTGKPLWSRDAVFNFRHNAIVVADGKVFCLDRMSNAKLESLKRRGVEPPGNPRLLALDGQTGKVLWSTTDDVFGTFLNYSTEHKVLLQAGSQYRDRAKDETGKGMVAYRGDTGEVLWKNLDQGYGGPCLLWKDKVITNGGGGFRLDLLTGKTSGDWRYSRMYGCNTAVGSQNLLTFRSGAAGYYDLAGDSGTGNIGGFRSSCTANLIVANGVLNAPDYTRTCSCAYQNQSSLALIHMPEAEMWTFTGTSQAPENFGLNLGAPGDRRDDTGMMWYEFPSVGGKSPDLQVSVGGKGLKHIRNHTSLLGTEDDQDSLDWVASSCLIGIESFKRKLPSEKARYTLSLHFAELENLAAGQRVFNLTANGETLLTNFDIFKEAGGRHLPIVREFEIEAQGELNIQVTAINGTPCLSGIGIRPKNPE